MNPTIEELKNKAVAEITKTIERYRSDTDAPNYVALVPSAQIDFAYLMGIISFDDFRQLHDLIDEATRVREERSV